MELTKVTFKYKDKIMGEITVPSGWIMETRNVAMEEFVEGLILEPEEVEEIEEDEEIIETVPLEPIPEPVSDEPIEEIEETIIIPDKSSYLVEGFLEDDNTGMTISRAVIKLVELGIETKSSSNGRFIFDRDFVTKELFYIPEGLYTMEVTSTFPDNYEPVTLQINVPEDANVGTILMHNLSPEPEPEEPIDPDKFRITGIQFTYLKKVIDVLPDSWHWHMNYTTKFYPLGQSTNWGVHWKPVAKTSRQVTFKIICTPSYGRQVTASKTVDIGQNARGLSVLYRGFPNLSKYVGDFKFEVFAYDGDELLDSKIYVVPGKRKADYE
jgi:hypothetical protein